MHPDAWYTAKYPKGGGPHHSFGYKVVPLGGSLSLWLWQLLFDKDACREGGQL